MKRISKIFLLLLILVVAKSAYAQTTLLSLSFEENAQNQYWWANGVDSEDQQTLRALLKSHGLNILAPEQHPNPPRLSPVVYGKPELSLSNAKNLATLYGAKRSINGKMRWHCETLAEGSLCSLQGNIEAAPATPRSEQKTSFSIHDSGFGANAREAKNAALQVAALSILVAVGGETRDGANDERIYPESLLIFRALNVADSLVELRRALRNIHGVNDLRERLASSGSVAIEVNPQQRDSEHAIAAIAQALISAPPQGMKLRQIREVAQGIEIEVIVY
ncbi:MAG: hypothetical protein WC966_11185 [Bradymonadales bacterium]|jgi:hypothetical protein